jgi:hypothetical protein
MNQYHDNRLKYSWHIRKKWFQKMEEKTNSSSLEEMGVLRMIFRMLALNPDLMLILLLSNF